jgi:hypothetical protein
LKWYRTDKARRWQRRPTGGAEDGAPASETFGGGAPAPFQTLWAPGLQPNHTWPATTGEQAGGMTRRPAKDSEEGDGACAEPLPTLKAGREVGWIFKNGEAVAIERHECEHRSRETAS